MDCDKLLAGVMAQISVPEVERLSSNADFIRIATFRFGPSYRLRIMASCLTSPGWASYHFEMSDARFFGLIQYGRRSGPRETREVDGVVYYDAITQDEGIVLEGPGSEVICLAMSFHHPRGPGPWYVGFHASAYDNSLTPVVILPDRDPLIIFPLVEPMLELLQGKIQGSATHQSFPEGYTCLLELWRNLDLHLTIPRSLLVFKMKAKSPISPFSQWRLVSSNSSKNDTSIGSPVLQDDNNVTRFFVNNEHYGCFCFERFDAGNMQNLLIFLSS